MRLTPLAMVLVGCFDPNTPLGVPCSDQGECPDGQQCDVLTNTCLPPSDLQVWLDDTAADFSREGAVLTEASVEALGFVGPAPYLAGRFRLAGIAGDVIADVDATTWDAIVAAGITGYGFSPDVDIDFGVDVPSGLGLTAADDITVLAEGEVLFDAPGAWRIELVANSEGFVEIAPPDGDFKRVVTSLNTADTGTYNVTTMGWHRVRIAFADNSMSMNVRLRVDSPVQAGGFRNITTDHMRVRVDNMAGYVIDGFEDAYLVNYRASTLVEDPLDSEYGADPLGMRLGSATWSMRWSGQVFFDWEGDYGFRLESQQGQRMWIDGKPLADVFDNNQHQTSTNAIHLDVGWHDVVIDVTKVGDGAPNRVLLQVESGPNWVGQTIPTDHVRPLMGRQVRWTSADSPTDLPIPEGLTASRTLFVDVPASVTMPLSIQAGYEIDHPVQASVSVVLDPPVGGNLTLLAAGGQVGAGSFYRYDQVPVGDFGGAWTFIAGDTNGLDLQTGTLTYAAITLVYAGGNAPFPTSYRYESAIRDLGEVTGLGTLRYKLRKTTEAKVQLRTCASADACAGEPWTEVANGAVPSVPVRKFAQYAVELTSDGDTATGLDSIELSYSVVAK